MECSILEEVKKLRLSGTDSFTYHANDGSNDSNIATVTITVNPINDAPVATGESYDLSQDTTFNPTAPGLLSNDTDAESDSLTAILDTDVSNGTLTLNADGSFSYEPNNGFSGTDSFSYHANDGQLDSNSVTVTLNVQASGPVVLFEDDFEVSEWNGKWVEDNQNAWSRSSRQATSGSYSAEVDGWTLNATLAMAQSVDTSNLNSALLTFDWMINRGFDNGEYLALDISTDGGTNWVQHSQLLGNDSQENVWHPVSIDLVAQGYVSTNLKIQFRARASKTQEDAYVDNVRIEGTGGAAPLAAPLAASLAAIELPTAEHILTAAIFTTTQHEHNHTSTNRSASKTHSLTSTTQHPNDRSHTESTTVDAIFAKWNEQISAVKIGQSPEFQLDGLLEKLTF